MAEPKYSEFFDWFMDTPDGDSGVYTHGSLITLSDIPQGASAENRVGDRVTLTSLQMKVFITPWNDTFNQDMAIGNILNNDFVLRIIIFTWKDSSVPELKDILEIDDHIVHPYWNVSSPLNHGKKVSRKILYDETTTHYYAGVSGQTGFPFGQNVVCMKDIYIPIKKFRNVEWSGGGTVVNSIYIFLISNIMQTGESQQAPWPVYIYNRINYKDIG